MFFQDISHQKLTYPFFLDCAEQFLALNKNSPNLVFSGTCICLRYVVDAVFSIWREKLAGGEAAETWKDIEIQRLKHIIKDSFSVLKKLSTIYVIATVNQLVIIYLFIIIYLFFPLKIFFFF